MSLPCYTFSLAALGHLCWQKILGTQLGLEYPFGLGTVCKFVRDSMQMRILSVSKCIAGQKKLHTPNCIPPSHHLSFNHLQRFKCAAASPDPPTQPPPPQPPLLSPLPSPPPQPQPPRSLSLAPSHRRRRVCCHIFFPVFC